MMDVQKSPIYLDAKGLRDTIFPGRSLSQIYKLVHRDRMPHKLIGRKMFFRPDEVVEWLEAHSKNPVV